MSKRDKDSNPTTAKCRNCKKILHDKNSKDVGYCLPCFAVLMSDEEE